MGWNKKSRRLRGALCRGTLKSYGKAAITYKKFGIHLTNTINPSERDKFID
jgi:hypothetical protein